MSVEPEAEDVESSGAPLIEHLTELRSRLVKSVLAFIVGMGICFTVWNPIFNFFDATYMWSTFRKRSGLRTYTYKTSRRFLCSH